jgi:uncharacterized protein (TIGR02246 family)
MATPDFADWAAITELKARYCRLMDGKDWDGWAALFTPDFLLDATASGGPHIAGRDAFVASIRRSLDAAITVHHVHMPEVTVSGDEATAIWPMMDHLVWPDGRVLTGYGHYHDRYVRSDGRWLIAESRLTRLHVVMVPPRDMP